MPDAPNPSSSKAGQAFQRLMERDPEVKASWDRARSRTQARIRDVADTIRRNMELAGDELEALGFYRPTSIEDWEFLAHIVEVPLETVEAGNWTARGIFNRALAWTARQVIRDNRVLSRIGGTTEPSPPRPAAATILSLGNRMYRIGDAAPIQVTENENNVLKAFLLQPAMDSRALVDKSGVGHAVQLLKRLREKYDQFAPAISLPGGKNQGGYRVTIQAV